MSYRYALWIAQMAGINTFRVSMFLAGAFVAVLVHSISIWPPRLRQYGEAVLFTIGGLAYAAILAYGILALGGIVANGR